LSTKADDLTIVETLCLSSCYFFQCFVLFCFVFVFFVFRFVFVLFCLCLWKLNQPERPFCFLNRPGVDLFDVWAYIHIYKNIVSHLWVQKCRYCKWTYQWFCWGIHICILVFLTLFPSWKCIKYFPLDDKQPIINQQSLKPKEAEQWRLLL